MGEATVGFRAGTFHVFTFKEGLLSRIAHDLRLSLERFEITLQPGTSAVFGRFWVESLRVDGTVAGNRLDPSGLKPKDVREILANIRKQVLRSAHHPTIDFEGVLDRDAGRLAGTLTMLGRGRPIALDLTEREGRVGGGLELRPSEWGIRPFKALMGAIRVQDRVRVEFELS